jgi:hypothetical protein
LDLNRKAMANNHPRGAVRSAKTRRLTVRIVYDATMGSLDARCVEN